jgi:hypothetical protein
MTIPNQARDSSERGFLQPVAPVLPLDDDALEDFLQQWMAGVAGVDGTMVRHRWQPEPPNIPDFGTDWVAIGITRVVTETFPWIGGNDPLYDQMQRHQTIDVMASFYGPHSASIAGRLRDGLFVSQNREILLLNEMGLVEVGEQRRAPDLIKNQWVDREDLTVTVRRRIVRQYPVRNIIEAHGVVTAQPPGDGLLVSSTFDARLMAGRIRIVSSAAGALSTGPGKADLAGGEGS